MATTVTLRRLGGSIVLAVPKKILGMVDLQEGSQARVSVENGRLIVEPRERRRYTLAELLGRSRRADLAPRRKDREWLNSPPIGREAL